MYVWATRHEIHRSNLSELHAQICSFDNCSPLLSGAVSPHRKSIRPLLLFQKLVHFRQTRTAYQGTSTLTPPLPAPTPTFFPPTVTPTPTLSLPTSTPTPSLSLPTLTPTAASRSTAASLTKGLGFLEVGETKLVCL